MKVNFTKYTEPIEKHFKDIESGDVIEILYGDINHSVVIVVDEIHPNKDDSAIQIHGRYIANGAPFTGYQFGNHVYERGTDYVIGKESA